MDKNSRHKMVVLVTDGEDLEKSGVAVAQRLATNGVVVFAIGVGTPAGKEVQFVNAAGQTGAGCGTPTDEVVRSRLDEADAARNRPGHRRQLLSARHAGRRPGESRPGHSNAERCRRIAARARQRGGAFLFSHRPGAGAAGRRIFNRHPP